MSRVLYLSPGSRSAQRRSRGTIDSRRIGIQRVPWAARRAVACLFGFFALLLALPTPSEAQIVRGLVVDEATEAPVATARVQLLDLDAEELRSTIADAEGRFTIQAPEPGSYLLRVSRIGYVTTVSDTLRLTSVDEALEVTLRLGIEAVALDPLTVEGRSSIAQEASYDGLYARHARAAPVGSERVFVKGDSWFEASIKPSDLVRVAGPAGCNPEQDGGPYVFWHGFLVQRRERAETLLDGSVDDLEGVEIYRSWTSIPLEYRLQIDQTSRGNPIPRVRACGVIVLWPRRPDYPR